MDLPCYLQINPPVQESKAIVNLNLVVENCTIAEFRGEFVKRDAEAYLKLVLTENTLIEIYLWMLLHFGNVTRNGSTTMRV